MGLIKIDPNLILVDANESTKNDVIDKLTALASESGYTDDLDMLRNDVRIREETAPTDFGNLIAIPHARSNAVNQEFVAFCSLKSPLIWNNRDVQLVFLIGVPQSNVDNVHLKMLATLSRHLIDADFRESLLNVHDKEVIVDILEQLT